MQAHVQAVLLDKNTPSGAHALRAIFSDENGLQATHITIEYHPEHGLLALAHAMRVLADHVTVINFQKGPQHTEETQCEPLSQASPSP